MWSYTWHCTLIQMHAKLSFFEQRFHYRMTVCFVETVLEVVVALRQDNKNGFSKHM